jgi:uncharacterized membrane protein YbhN (UPF0104 family)
VLSRTPGIPQGLGVVEVSGFAVLSSMNLAIVEVGAILVMWDFVRIVVPLGLALLFSLTLGRPPPLGGRGA